MALTVDVHPGDVVASPWGNEIRNRSLQAFASTAERDSQWGTAPNGAICLVLTGTDAVLYHRRGGTWQALHVSSLTVDGAVVFTAGPVTMTAGSLTLTAGNIGVTVGNLTLNNGIMTAVKNTTDKTWANAQLLSQGDAGNGARVTMFNPGVGGQQLGVFGGGAAGPLYLLDHNGTTRGTINFTATSGAATKTEIEPFDDGDVVERLDALDLVTFRRIHGPDPDGGPTPPGPVEVGLIAEQAAPHVPEVIRHDDQVDGALLHVDQLVFLMLAALQQLSGRVAALEGAA